MKSIKAPQAWTDIMITGGVAPTKENLTAWFEAGAACVGMGSKLVSKDLLAKGDYKTLTKNTKQALALIKKIRG